MKVTIKWQGQTFDTELDPSQGVPEFKALVYSLTGVPLDRQKLMCKAWKTTLKDDASFANIPDLKDGAVITLMGSSEGLVKPVEKQVFVEDLPASHAAVAGYSMPSGLINLGNTCYANSTLEALRFVPELKDSLLEYRRDRALLARPGAGAAAGGAGAAGMVDFRPLDLSLAELYASLDATPQALPPMGFLARLRGACPQFDEHRVMQDGSLAYKQQDAEEFHNAIMTALAAELKSPSAAVPKLSPEAGDQGPNLVDTLFGIALEKELKCKETDTEPPVQQREFHRKIVCNIEGGAGKSVQINHIHEGIRYGLEGELEKNSDVLNRNAIWSTTARVDQLPKYLCVQMMRFYWKATPESRDHAGVKCKMLRPVAFPADNFDMYEFCTKRVQAVLKVERDRVIALENEKFKKGAAAAAAGSTAAPASASVSAPAPAAGAGRAAAASDVEMASDDPDLAAALAMSIAPASAPAPAAVSDKPIGYGLPAGFRGLYELFAVVTHKGRSADSGHYMGWVRKAGDLWHVFDDDHVSETSTEYVVSHLKGGGDDHMAYLLFYRAKGGTPPTSATASPSS